MPWLTRRSHLPSVACALGALLLSALPALTAAPAYFPEVLACGTTPDYRVPPDSLLAGAPQAPPVPLFAAAFEDLAKGVLDPRWLPDGFEDARYIAYGQGAYRARTAHLCLVYTRAGTRIILKGFEDRIVALLDASPATPSPEATDALKLAAEYSDPCEELESHPAPPSLVLLLTDLRDQLLAAPALPVSDEHWTARLGDTRLVRGGIEVSFKPKGPFTDPTVGEADPGGTESRYSAAIWTNGASAAVTLTRTAPMKTLLRNQLQPLTEVTATAAHLPHGVRAFSADEWLLVDPTPPSGAIPHASLVAHREQANRRKLYFELDNGSFWASLVPPEEPPSLMAEAAWLCLAKSALSGVSNNDYGYVDHRGSASDVLNRLAQRRARHEQEVSRLEQAPAPATLSGLRVSLLSAFQRSQSAWEVAWPYWQSALNRTQSTCADYDALRTTVREQLQSRALWCEPFTWGAEQCSQSIREAEQTLGVITDEAIYDP